MNILSQILKKSPEEIGKIFQEDIKEFNRLLFESTLNELLLEEMIEFLENAFQSKEEDYRNGYYNRTLYSTLGPINAKIPRDRLNQFKTKLVGRYRRTLDDFEDEIVNLYIKGLSTNEIIDYLVDNSGLSVSKEMVRKKVNLCLDEAKTFNERNLPKCVYIYLDGTYVPIRRTYAGSTSSVEKECIEVAIGITETGESVVLGYWFIPNEGASSWEDNLKDLKNRGIGNPSMFITDGLNGLCEAIEKVFPDALYQVCNFHECKGLSRKVRKKDRKEISNDYMNIFKTFEAEEVKARYNAFIKKWRCTYPAAIANIEANEHLFTYMKAPKCLWKALYTSNRIEGFNAKLKRTTRKKILLNSESNAIIVITSICQSYNKRGGNRFPGLGELTDEERSALGFK